MISSLNASSNVAAAASTSSTTETIQIQTTTHHYDHGNMSDGNGSDEDILHVVTNVYTIPIIKSTSAGNGPFLQSSQQHINTTTSFDDDLLSGRHHSIVASTSVPIVLGEARLDQYQHQRQHQHQHQHHSMKRVIDATQEASHQNQQQIMTTSMTQSGQDLAKSKFQIRSIVEVYESEGQQQQQQQQQEINISFKSATHVEETTHKEIINEPILKGKI